MMSGSAGQSHACVAVAYSGGRDSTALLHATASAAKLSTLADGAECLRVAALHVHHGLSTHADAWLCHAEETCAAFNAQGLPVTFHARRVHVPHARGQSLEAEARRARYAALADMAHEVGARLVLLAHHRRDQAETVLLQALRGAGVAGLSAMPADSERDGIRWVRPWLDHPREAIEAYLEAHGLRCIEDDSNDDPRFARNRLRREVWPALRAAFPQAEAALAASARRVADALPALEAWREDLLNGASTGQDGLALDAVKWAEWPAAARRQAIAHWYLRASGQALPASWIERLSAEVPSLVQRGRSTRWPGLCVSLFRGVLRVAPHAGLRDSRDAGGEGQERLEGLWRWERDDQSARPAPRAGSARPTLPAASSVRPAPAQLRVPGPGAFEVPGWHGALIVTACDEGGVAPQWVQQLTARPRQGGEQFQAGPGRPPRALKKQYQAAGVPAWERAAPLFFSGDELVFVPGLGVDARCLARRGERQWHLKWEPGAPP